MLEGLALLISGALLLTPGFVTDTIGFVLLVPPLRRALIRRVLENSQVIFRHSGSARFQQRGHHYHRHDTTIIDGEIVDEDDPRHLH
jgi:UPF0716 protein FxsA